MNKDLNHVHCEERGAQFRSIFNAVNEAAEKYFVGNAQELKKLEMIENSLRDNAKIVITEHDISPTLLLGSPPIKATTKSGSGKGVKLIN